MNTLVDTLVEAGWEFENFDSDPSAVFDHEDLQLRVTLDDTDRYLILSGLDTEDVMLWSLEGEGDPAPILIQHAPTLSVRSIPAMVRELVDAQIIVTGGAGVVVDAPLENLDRLPDFREHFWQVVPYEDGALGRYEGEQVDVELIESGDGATWELLLSRDDDFEDAYRLPASDQAAQIILGMSASLTVDSRHLLPDALADAGIELEVEVTNED